MKTRAWFDMGGWRGRWPVGRGLGLVILLLHGAGMVRAQQVPAQVPFFEDFSSPPTSAWSHASRVGSAEHGQILGQFGNDPVTLQLSTTPGQGYDIFFDLWAIDSWDGNHPTWGGPDRIRMLVDGATSFDYALGWNNDEVPDWPERYGWDQGYGDGSGDTLYRRMNYAFTAVHNVTTITFDAEGLGSLADESWGMDNVRVVASSDALAHRFLFREFGKRTQINAGTASGWPSQPQATPILWADMDGNGLLDPIQGGNSNISLLMQTGTLVFVNRSIGEQGLGLAVMDFDHDGRLDLWRVRSDVAIDGMQNVGGHWNGSWQTLTAQDATLQGVSGVKAFGALDANADGWCDLVMLGADANEVALNGGVASGGGTHPGFTRTTSVLPQDGLNRGAGAWMATGDLNNDGVPDIFSMVNSGRLFLSNGMGGFAFHPSGISVETGASNAAGASFGDFDNDGDLDLFVGARNAAHEATLWINDGTNQFVERAWNHGLGGLTNVTSGAWGDYDNDGDLDLGVVRASGSAGLFRNDGAASGWYFAPDQQGIETYSFGGDITFVDVDNDTDLDLSFTSENQFQYSRHYENLSTNGARALKVLVVGRGAGGLNRAGVGARVELWNADNTVFLQRRDLGLVQGMNSMTPLQAHFGGVVDSAEYTIRLYVGNSSVSTKARPSTSTTTIDGVTIPRCVMLDEAELMPVVRVVRWRELMADE